MPRVTIGPDGSIIKDGQVVESDGSTVIREDGTIETSNNIGHSYTPSYNSSPPANYGMNTMMPMSPLERSSNNSNYDYNTGQSSGNSVVDTKAISEKEFDIQMMEGRIRSCNPTKYIIATVILGVIGLFGLYILFIPAVVTGILIFVEMNKKSELEAQKNAMIMELDSLKEKYR